MKETLLLPSMLLGLVVVTGFSACTGGDSTTAPAPLPQPSSPRQPPPPASPANGLGIALMITSGQTVDQPVTFVVAASSSVAARFDFGDGDQEAFDLEAMVSRTVTHKYRSPGTFVATLTASNAAGQSVSVPTTLIVR